MGKDNNTISGESNDEFLSEFSEFKPLHEEEECEDIKKECYGRIRTQRKDYLSHLSCRFKESCSVNKDSFSKFKYVFDQVLG